MVNVGFPAPAGYGFEMVDGPGPRIVAENRHQSNIYAESNQSDIRQFFGDLTSMQTLAIYRRLLVKDELRDRPHRLRGPSHKPAMDRNGCEYRNGIERDGCEMFFLLRMAFWLGLVLVLLPREKTPESDKLPQLGASEAVSAATAAVSDMSQFCKRQPAACEVGGQAATVIGQRAQQGARKLYQIITDKRASDHTGSIGDAENAGPAPAAAAPRDTLAPDDLLAEWRGAP
jgi:Family of unknown function (DUF5330)